MKKGIFITFEGPEGCGKSTHSRLLNEYLSSLNYRCILTREPGGTDVGERIRRLLLSSEQKHISVITEIFLFEASRAQLVKEVIRPNLEKGQIVVCDRFSDATLCYQGYGYGFSLDLLRRLDRVATDGLIPDLTILLDIDPVRGLNKAWRKGPDRIERKDIDYHKRVREGYLRLAKKEPSRIKVIKVMDKIEKTQQIIRGVVMDVISRYKGA